MAYGEKKMSLIFERALEMVKYWGPGINIVFKFLSCTDRMFAESYMRESASGRTAVGESFAKQDSV